jgi:iron complex outermembrane receptor protein
VRTPSRIEESFQFSALAVPSIPLYLRLIGDGNFSSEQLVGYELGYRTYVRRGGFISIAGFYNRYNDLLSVENRPPAPEASPEPLHLVLPLYLRNGIEALTKGMEVSTLWDVRSWWRLRASYSYLHISAGRHPTSNDASTVGQLQGDSPEHKAVVQCLLTLPRGFDADLAYRYVGALTGTDQKVPGYSTGDARIARRISREFTLSLVGRNLFQPRHAEYGGDPGGLVAIRRSGFLELTWAK